MKSTVAKRSIGIDGRKTSVTLEDAFWNLLKEIAQKRGQTVSDLVAEINEDRDEHGNLSSAIRLFVLTYAQAEASERQRGQTAKGVNGPQAIGA
jgi:predicted DNA-binding ribbon-helix-helix protein